MRITDRAPLSIEEGLTVAIATQFVGDEVERRAVACRQDNGVAGELLAVLEPDRTRGETRDAAEALHPPGGDGFWQVIADNREVVQGRAGWVREAERAEIAPSQESLGHGTRQGA